MSKETGGPAFPYSGVHHTEAMNYIIDSHGMTLRDYLAAKAMQGMLANPEWNHMSTAHHAKHAYEVADFMLAARGQ